MSNRSLTAIRKIYPIIILLLVSFWPLYLYVFSGNTIFVSSRLHHYPPLRYNAVRMMLEGHLPLWNPFILTGISLIGDAVSNPFDILNIVLIFLKPAAGFSTLSSVQLFLSGFFMYIYLRKSLQLAVLSSLLGGLLNVFSPVLIYGAGIHLDFIDPIGSFLWLPLIMLFFDKAFETQSSNFSCYAVILGMILSFALFSGNVNIVFFIAIFITLNALFQPVPFRRKLVVLAIAGTVSVLITSVQLGPMLEVANNSHRAILWQPTAYDFTGLQLSSLVYPYSEYPGKLLAPAINEITGGAYHRTPWEPPAQSLYIGIFNLFLLILAFVAKTERRRIRRFKRNTIALILFLLSLSYLPLRGILITVLPVLKGVHFGYSIFLVYFCFIVLISYVFNMLIYNDSMVGTISNIIDYSKRFVNVVYCIGIVIIILFGFRRKDIFVNAMYSDNRLYILKLIAYLVLFYCCFYVLHKIIHANKDKKVVWGSLLIFLIVLNSILLWESEFLSTHQNDHFEKHFKESAETRFLKTMQSTDRLEIIYGNRSWLNIEYTRDQYFGFNLPAFYKASISGGSHQLHSGRYRKFYDMINLRYPFDSSYYWSEGRYVKPSGRVYLDNYPVDFQILDLIGVKYIFSPGKVNEGFFRLIGQGDSYFLYENLNSFDRCFIVDDFEVLNSDEILRAMHTKKFNLKKTVLLEKPVNFHNDEGNAGRIDDTSDSVCDITRYTPNEVFIQYSSPKGGILVLSDAYDVGWKAYVDDRNVETFRANYIFRGIVVPEGNHVVRFRYMPLSFVVGCYASVITFFCCLGFLLFRCKATFCSAHLGGNGLRS